MPISRAQLINFHLTLSAFFLPFALMFLVTGALYMVSIKGSATSRQEVVPISEPLQRELAPLVAQAAAALDQLGIPAPSGAASIRSAGSSFQLEWSGVARDITLKPSDNPGEAVLTINESSPYRRLVQLHKGKGNWFGKGTSILWTAGLAAIFLSGLSMVVAVPKYRRLALISGSLGTALFIAYYFLG